MIEHFLSLYLRTVLKRSWNELMVATRDPARMQTSRLLDIIFRNTDTDFGRAHDFAGIRSVADFQARVPVRAYEDIEPYIKRMRLGEKRVLTCEDPEIFGRTSGTTGEPKFIPVTPSFYEEFSKMQKMWQRKAVVDHKEMLCGKILSVMSPEVEGYTESGIPYGAMSGYSYRLQYPITQGLYAVPYEVMCVGDFDSKYYLILRLALEQRVAIIAAMNPSTILLLMKKLNTHAEQLCRDLADGAIGSRLDVPVRLRRHLREQLRPNKRRAREIEALAERGPIRGTDVWESLRLIITWQGGPASFFLKDFPKYFSDIPLRDMGLIATEAYFSIPLCSNTPDGLLAITGHFFEFFEVDSEGRRSDTPFGCDQLEVGKRYYIVVTTSGGLYRYDICDVVEVVDFYNRTPVIVFRHKGGNITSVTGEKLTESQVTDAMRAAASAMSQPIEGFAFALRLGDPPSYVLALETAERNSTALARLLARFESELRLRNIEYVAKRDSGRLGTPSLCLLPAGFYEQLRKARVARGVPDGQFKTPHLLSDLSQLGEVRPIAEIETPRESITQK